MAALGQLLGNNGHHRGRYPTFLLFQASKEGLQRVLASACAPVHAHRCVLVQPEALHRHPRCRRPSLAVRACLLPCSQSTVATLPSRRILSSPKQEMTHLYYSLLQQQPWFRHYGHTPLPPQPLVCFTMIFWRTDMVSDVVSGHAFVRGGCAGAGGWERGGSIRKFASGEWTTGHAAAR